MFDRVVVGVKFSEAGRIALKRGADLAAELGIPAFAIHVVDMPNAMIEAPDWFKEVPSKMEELLQAWVAPYPGVTAIVRSGDPAELLIKETTPNSLLIVGREEQRKPGLSLPGSTATRVAQDALCDVLLVRGDRNA